jgi:hypothetical protein
MLHLLWVLIFTFTQLNQARFTVYEAQGQKTKSFFFRLMSLLHVLINFVHFFFKINCLISTCMNAFKAGHIYTYTYIYLTVKQAYHHHKNDGRVEISDVCGDRLFDRRRFRLLCHLFVQFNSILYDIDFFCSLNWLS